MWKENNSMLDETHAKYYESEVEIDNSKCKTFKLVLSDKIY